MKNILIITLFVAALSFGTIVIGTPQKPDLLTTNIDFANRIINDDGIVQNDGTFFSIAHSHLGSFVENLREDLNAISSIANPSLTSVRVKPGMRKEEVASLFEKKFKWTTGEKGLFLGIHEFADIENAEGYYYPGTYVVPKKIGGNKMAQLMINRFNDEVLPRYASSTNRVISLETALKIASMIEREASGKNDMRLISGIVWNRIFQDMTLDIDATIQYAKGNEKDGWWPALNADDKFIESPYNTYQNKGLTPTPISNPNLVSIQAALNPKKTDCLFYLHDSYGRIHCTETYKEHVKNIERYYNIGLSAKNKSS